MTPAALPVLTIDGNQFDDLDGFAREFSTLLQDYNWHGNLDAFNDILRGGFGTPEGGFALRWLNSARSRQALGWEATIAWHERTLTTCHPANRDVSRPNWTLPCDTRAQHCSTGSSASSWITVPVEPNPRTK